MTTTEQILVGKGTVKSYGKFEIKRKYSTGYEADWLDVSKYLLKEASISRYLDSNNFSYGQFRTASANIVVDNNGGAFLPPRQAGSLFYGAQTRHYTKVQYSAGYYDEDGDKIDEVVFKGLLTSKGIYTDFESGECSLNILSYDGIFAEAKTGESQFTATNTTVKEIVASIMTDTAITTFITYDAGEIDPAINTTFDHPEELNNLPVIDVFDRIAQKSNSIWYVDFDTDKLMFRDRDTNVKTAYVFKGGDVPGRTNIVEITKFDEGYGNLINYITYDTGTQEYVFTDSASIALYGVNELSISGAELTTYSEIQTLCNSIISKFAFPKKRISLKTHFLPNVLDFFDPVTITYYRQKELDLDIMYFNKADNYWNNNEVYLVVNSALGFVSPANFVIIGWKHDTKRDTTVFELVEP